MANANGKITWTNERRKLSDLIPWPRNPRQIKTDQAKRLVESFDQFGQVETIAIGPDGDIYNGHQRLNVLAEKYGKDYEIEVRVSDRALSEKEREKLTIFLHKGAAGEWDFDTLANEFELDDLLEWGFAKGELGLMATSEGFDFSSLPDQDRAPFRQMTFTLHDEQVEIVENALSLALKLGEFSESKNENSNGNAITYICEVFNSLPDYGNG